MKRLAIAAFLLVAPAAAQGAPPDLAALTTAAEAGDAEAAFRLGRRLYDSAEDKAEARRWLKAAADLGHVRAATLLGLMTMAGVGGAADRDEARRLFLFAASGGDATALYHLGVLYAEGPRREGGGPAQDAVRALFWFQTAAECGDVDAMSNLGLMHLRGIGVKADKAEAYRWYLRAAMAGDGQAQFIVATLLYAGEGAEKDTRGALTWYYRAKANGVVDDRFELELTGALGADDIEAAHRDAALPLSAR